MYTSSQTMAQLMMDHPELLPMISQFGIALGVEDLSIREVCLRSSVDPETFLHIVHYYLYQQSVDPSSIDIPTLQRFIENGHTFYLRHLLPRIRQMLIEAINPADETSKVPILILQFYDEYVRQIKNHIRRETAGMVQSHDGDDNQHIAKKLSELTNLIIKYFPQPSSPVSSANTYLSSLIQVLYATEQQILLHCNIEDQILTPALRANRTEDDTNTNELTDREKEVLIQVVKGLHNHQIADQFFISIHTVLTHRKNIARKLNIHSVSGLTIYALVNHLITIDDLR